MEPEFTIAEDFDPDSDMRANADPMAEYLTYVADVRGGAVGDMGFYVAGLPALHCRPTQTCEG